MSFSILKENSNIWKFLFFLLILVLGIIAVLTGADYGISWDYQEHDRYGKQIWDWYHSPSRAHEAVNQGMKYYGPLLEIIVNLQRAIFSGDEVAIKSTTTFFVGLAGVVACFWAGITLVGYRAGFISALLLAFTPMYYGHGFINHKDLPFAVTYIFALACMLYSLKDNRKISFYSILLVGFSIGLCFSVRIGGIFLIPLLFIAWIYPTFVEDSKFRFNFKILIHNLLAIPVALFVAWLVMITLWPFMLLNPISGPQEVFARNSMFPWSHTVLFEGQNISAQALPLRYLFVWFEKTLADVFIIPLILGALLLPFLAIRYRKLLLSKQSFRIALVICSIVLPIALLLIKKSTIYDAVRHLLFVVPPLALLAGISANYLFGVFPRVVSLVLAGLFIFGNSALARDLVSLHPYQYVYFNKIFGGGLKSAYGQFETEYWATCMKESIEWVAKNVPVQTTPLKVAAWCDPLQVTYYIDLMKKERPDLVFTNSEAEADLYLTTSRFGGHLKPYKLLNTISRQDVPLCFIFDKR